MELNFAFLANSAEVAPDGRFFVMGGGIDGFASHQVPGILPTLSVLASIRFSAEECGQDYHFWAKLVLPDGSLSESFSEMEAISVLSPRIPVETPGIGPNLKVSMSLVLGLVLPQFGMYRFDFFVRSHVIGHAYFNVYFKCLHERLESQRRSRMSTMSASLSPRSRTLDSFRCLDPSIAIPYASRSLGWGLLYSSYRSIAI